ncbi:hypothetical protein SGPA1_40914 [Streptomyces misionensis JCM 4497]
MHGRACSCGSGGQDGPRALPAFGAQPLQHGVGGGEGLVHRPGAGHHAQRVRGVLQLPAGVAGGLEVMAETSFGEAGQQRAQFLLRRQQHSDIPLSVGGHTAPAGPRERILRRFVCPRTITVCIESGPLCH